MDYQLLLLEDVRKKGRKGDVVKVKPGFARNFLLPQNKAVVADKRTLRMQQKLKEERAEQAIVDKAEAERLALEINDKVFTTQVKVDPVGHLYGSVSAADIAGILAENEITIDKNWIHLPHPIKKLGEFRIVLNLKEGVKASFLLKVHPDRPIEINLEEKAAEEQAAAPAPESEEEEPAGE